MTNLLQRFVDFATGEVTADVNNSKVTTDAVDIKKSIDTTKPDEWYFTIPYVDIDNIGGGGTSGSGGKGNDADSIGLAVTSGSTQGSDASILQRNPRPSTSQSFDNNRRWRAGVHINDLNEEAYVVMGTVTRTDKTRLHAGVLFEGGDIKATVGNGSSQDKSTTLVSGASSGEHDIYLEFDAGTEVRIWVNADPDVDAPTGVVSSGLPSGTNNNDEKRPFSIIAANPNTATTVRLELYELRFRGGIA